MDCSRRLKYKLALTSGEWEVSELDVSVSKNVSYAINANFILLLNHHLRSICYWKMEIWTQALINLKVILIGGSVSYSFNMLLGLVQKWIYDNHIIRNDVDIEERILFTVVSYLWWRLDQISFRNLLNKNNIT